MIVLVHSTIAILLPLGSVLTSLLLFSIIIIIIIYRLCVFSHLQEEEHKELAHSVMGKKSKRLYDRMQYGIGVKDSKAAALHAKAEALEAPAGGKKGAKGDKTRKAGAAVGGAAAKKARRK